MKNLLFVLIVLILTACGSSTPTASTPVGPAPVQSTQPETAPEITRDHYNPSRTLLNDLIHTRLDVRFDFQKSRLEGKAWLKFTPYFYSQDSLILDAKGFDLKKVSLDLGKGKLQPLSYHYDSLQIFIKLDKTYSRKDTFNIYIEYTAKPDERKTGGSEAITSDKGLYFIDPLDKDPKKPTQIWTQGETESNSAWFPTIDTPNEKTTQEICITVEEKYATLSNGLLQYSTNNGDGTRTDCWKQNQPHAPYLIMMAVGEYAIVKDKWRDLEVNYYIEDDYKNYARDIFGNTPEMIEFYSDLLGVTYPWEKYHQVIVRDYVSGAMENTGAVIFGEFMNQTDRELLDGDNESIIAHELFHHWFGDLVTTESWANLPLNESFATYGEYLWIEHKYGLDAADEHNLQGLSSYLMESRSKQVDMIRYDYIDKEDMFDSHSYAKGGRILHMLRNHIGDDAFFAGLKKYLDDHRYGTAEIHDLRLAFEEVTGQDLNWFFNQWFLSSGHPKLKVDTWYNESTKKAGVSLIQSQDFTTTPLYRLPMAIDIYAGGKKTRYEIVFDEVSDTLYFDSAVKPDLINVDADKMLLAETNEMKTAEEYLFQFRNAPLFLDRLLPLESISKTGNDSLTQILVFEALDDPYHTIREAAIRNLKKVATDQNRERIITKLTKMGAEDPKSGVRASAINFLASNYDDDRLLPMYEQAMQDSSYGVVGAALAGIAKADTEKAFTYTKELEKDKNASVISVLSNIYGTYGRDEHHDFFVKNIDNVSGFSRFGYVNNYKKFLSGASDETILKSLPVLKKVSQTEGPWYMRLGGIQALNETASRYDKKAQEIENNIQSKTAKGEDVSALESEKAIAVKIRDEAVSILEELRKTETDENLQKFLN